MGTGFTSKPNSAFIRLLFSTVVFNGVKSPPWGRFCDLPDLGAISVSRRKILPIRIH